MNRRMISQGLKVAGIAVAFVAGSQVAKVARGAAGSQGSDAASKSDGVAGYGGTFGEIAGRDGHGNVAGGWPEMKQRVVKRWEASPSVMLDFELRDETMRLLEKIPAADLDAWMRELRSDEVGHEMDVPLQLREMVLEVLARRLGGSLIQSLAANPTVEVEEDMDHALDHWMEGDPAAALDWLSGELPEVIAEDSEWHRKEAFEFLAGKDPAEFERRLSMADEEMRKWVLEDYASRKGSVEGRGEVLARAEGSPHGEAMALWSGLLSREGTEDPVRAYETLKGLNLSPEDRAKLDEGLVYHLLYPTLYVTEKVDGGAVMDSWMERNPGDAVPKGIVDSFGRWGRNDAKGAIAWIEEQPAGPRHDLFAKVLIEQRIEEYDTVVGMIARIGDADLRSEMQQRLKKSWQADDAAAAAEWERGLPEEDGERLRERGDE
jgi:hypothetical protein